MAYLVRKALGSRWNVKNLTGDSSYSVRGLFKSEFELNPQFKIWIASNYFLEIKSVDEGTLRKIRFIPFNHTFKRDERDINFYRNNIEPELSHILSWAIEGAIKWTMEGVTIPEKVEEALKEYAGEIDTIGRFIDECCITSEGEETAANSLYQSYRRWCYENGEKEITNVKFSRKVLEKGFKKIRQAKGNMYVGIGLV